MIMDGGKTEHDRKWLGRKPKKLNSSQNSKEVPLECQGDAAGLIRRKCNTLKHTNEGQWAKCFAQKERERDSSATLQDLRCKNSEARIQTTTLLHFPQDISELRWLLQIHALVAGQAAEVRGRRGSDSAWGVLLPPLPFPSSLPLLLWRS
jgi:hypothetical protein